MLMNRVQWQKCFLPPKMFCGTVFAVQHLFHRYAVPLPLRGRSYSRPLSNVKQKQMIESINDS